MTPGEYYQQESAFFLQKDEALGLLRAAEALERTCAEGPYMFPPGAGNVRDRPSALIALLDFTLGTDEALTKPAREALIAEVVDEFLFPKAHRGKEYVRTTLKDMRRRADRAHGKAKTSGSDPQGVIATYAASQLVRAGIIAWNDPEVAAAPNGRGVRVVLEVDPRQ
jgi:hypothetical protein